MPYQRFLILVNALSTYIQGTSPFRLYFLVITQVITYMAAVPKLWYAKVFKVVHEQTYFLFFFT